MYKAYSETTLNRMTKNEIIHQLRIAESNYFGALATIEQQYQNTKDWQPVKHGKWIQTKCSNCNFDCEQQYAHCPNCGAKMDSGG